MSAEPVYYVYSICVFRKRNFKTIKQEKHKSAPPAIKKNHTFNFSSAYFSFQPQLVSDYGNKFAVGRLSLVGFYSISE